MCGKISPQQTLWKKWKNSKQHFFMNCDLSWLPGNKWSCLSLLIYHHSVLPASTSIFYRAHLSAPCLVSYLFPPSSLSLQIVYVAPMKALAAEMTNYFSKRLEPLGITVKELTGDMQLTKGEILRTQVNRPTPPVPPSFPPSSVGGKSSSESFHTPSFTGIDFLIKVLLQS